MPPSQSISSLQPVTTESPEARFDLPDAPLRRLVDKTEQMLRALDRFGVTERRKALYERALRVYRRLKVTTLLDQQYLVAVAGLQGTGKTTMMKSLYGIPDAYLPSNLGRGEKLPVLLSESDDNDGKRPSHATDENSHQAFVHRFEDGGTVKHKISPSDCEGTALEPDPSDVLLELTVPPRFFGGKGRGFLLLPGIELADTAWGALVEHVLPSASTGIYTVNQATLASGEDGREMKAMREQLGGVELVYAITHADEARRADRRELVDAAQERFDVTDERRIVLVEPARQERPAWAEPLKNALSAYGEVPRSHRRKQIEMLREVLRELDEVVGAVREEGRLQDVTVKKQHREKVDPVVDHLDDAIEDVRKPFKKQLKKRLQHRSREATRHLKDGITEEGWLTKLKRFVQGKSLKRQLNFEDLIADAWQEPLGKDGPRLDEDLLHVVNRVAHRSVPGAHALLESAPRKESSPAPQNRLPDRLHQGVERQGAEDAQHLPALDESLGDVRLLVISQEDKMISQEDKMFSDVAQSVKWVPLLGLQAMRLQAAVDVANEASDVEPGEEGQWVKEFNNTRGSGADVLKGVALMVGVDVAPDAEFDVAQDILTSLGAKEAAAATAGVWIAAGLVAGYGAAATHRALKNADLKRAEQIDQVMENVRRKQEEAVLEVFDDNMERLKEHVTERLARVQGVPMQLTNRINLQMATADVHRSSNTVKDHLPHV